MRLVLTDARVPMDPGRSQRLAARLPSVERERVMRFRRWIDAQCSLVGHALMLELVAQALGGDRGPVELTRGEHERPFIARPEGTRLDVNMSHSGGFVAAALCAGGFRVGVDVERERKVYPGVAERCFGPEELAWLGPESSAHYRPRFFQLWTLKESLVKARGDGISSDLKAIRFEVGDAGIGVFVRGEPPRWRSITFRPAPQLWMSVTTDAAALPDAFEWVPPP